MGASNEPFCAREALTQFDRLALCQAHAACERAMKCQKCSWGRHHECTRGACLCTCRKFKIGGRQSGLVPSLLRPGGLLNLHSRPRGLSLLPPKPFCCLRNRSVASETVLARSGKISDQGDCSVRVNHSLPPRITSISDASRATSRVLTQLWQSAMHKQQLVADLRYVWNRLKLVGN